MIAEQTTDPTGTQIISQKGSIRSEAELLLCCIRHQFNTATSAEIADLLRNDLDWDAIMGKAVENNVFLLFYQTLKNTHPELIPPSIYEQLQVEAQKRIGRNLFLTKELFEVLDLLAARDIQAIPFKGPIWATLAYGNMALRDFSDLDILVRPKDFPKAKDLLKERGYCGKYSDSFEAEIEQSQMLRHDGKVNIDLHFGLAPQFFYLRVNSESFFEGLQTISIAGRPVTTFSPENTLALGYIHGAKEDWNFLKRICDFAALIQIYPDVNWQDILAGCGTNYSDRKFWLGIAIAQRYLQISLPKELAVHSKQFPELAELAKQHEQFVYHKLAEYSYISHVFSFLGTRETNLWSKVRYFLKIAVDINEKDREKFALPSFLFFLYYPLRIIRLLKTYKIGKGKIAFLWDMLRR
ncbi:MAG: nucleotidyltransferase family protein [Hormoscilla sp.]